MNFIVKLLELLFGKKAAPAPTKPPAPPIKPAPAQPPKAVTPMAWMGWAHHEATDGIEEEPNKDNRGPVIRRYISLAKCGREGDPYCAIFVNAALEQAGIRGTRSAMARSFETDPNFVRLPGPAYGAIMTFWRGSKAAGTGHTGFYVGETPGHVTSLGANQHDDCNETSFPVSGATFGLVGFYWPKAVPLPAVKKIALNSQGKPVDLKVT